MKKKKKPSPKKKSIDKSLPVKIHKEEMFKNILIRMPTSLVDEVDKCVAKKPWITRTHWIVDAIHGRLIEEAECVSAIP